MQASDDLGNPVEIPRTPTRVVSLVPSLTEAIAVSAPGVLVGATEWCTHPADLAVERVGGTKNPALRRIVELGPDLVVANEEENRQPDVDALREAGLPVWVTDVRTVDQALSSLESLLEVLAASQRDWLREARQAWANPDQVVPERRLRAVVPIWRKPWMAIGSDTYAGDVLARLGVDNVLAGHHERYPRVEPADLPQFDLVVLPDEPYRFTDTDGPQYFPSTPYALLDGRSLTWYGPAMCAAPKNLVRQLRTGWARGEEAIGER